MKNRVLLLYLVSLSALFAFQGVGEEESASIRPLRIQTPQPEALNRFGLSCRMGFNIKTSFKHFGEFSNPFPRVNLDGARYNYDNGYVFPDLGTPSSGLTHFWGYQGFSYTRSGQVPGDGTLLMQRASSPGLNPAKREQDSLPGIELTYNRQLGRHKNLRWGLEAAFNYMNVSHDDGALLYGSADVLTDVYALPFPDYLIRPPGYEGREEGPGQVISASPQSRNRTALPTTVGGFRRFDADIFGFRLGPYLELPLSKRFSLALSGGLALAEISSDFGFTQTLRIGSTRLPSTLGSGSHSDLLAGGYVSGTVSCALSRSADLFAGVQFQDLGQYSHVVNRKEAVLDLSQSLFVTFGLSYTF